CADAHFRVLARNRAGRKIESGKMRLNVPKKRFKTSIANGSQVLAGVDGRSHVARRYREVSSAIGSDLGGVEHLTEAQLQLIRSAAGLVVLREALDVKAVNGEAISSNDYCKIANGLRRVLTTIGLERVPKEVNGIEDEAYAIYEQELNAP